MHWFDPNRPKSPSGHLLLTDGHTRMPNFSVEPYPDGTFYIYDHMPVGGNSFRFIFATIVAGGLVTFFEGLKNDPEHILLNCFQYSPPAPEIKTTHKARPSISISLEDLGL